MKVYVSLTQSSDHVAVIGVSWTRIDANQKIHSRMKQDAENGRFHEHQYLLREIEIDPLAWLVDAYFKFRHYEEPDADEALYFLTSECGELNDAHVHARKAWVRNNPIAKAANRLSFEVGDCLMMLTKFASKFNIDPLTAMVEKFQSKGWQE